VGVNVTLRCSYRFLPYGPAAPAPFTLQGPQILLASPEPGQLVGAAGQTAMTITGAAAHAGWSASHIGFWLNGSPLAVPSLTTGLLNEASLALCAEVPDPDCPFIGFSAQLPLTNLPVGENRLSIGVATNDPQRSTPNRLDVPFTVDPCVGSAPPTAAWTSPAAGSQLTGVVTLGASASGQQALAGVDFLVDEQVVGNDSTAPYSLTWSTTTTTAGPHTLRARARDRCGRAGLSAPVSVSVSNPPRLQVKQDHSGQGVGAGSTVAVGSTTIGVPVSMRFRIENVGSAPLVLSSPAGLVQGSCFQQIVPTSPIPAGGAGYFRVRLLCGAPGNWTGTVSIQSDDTDEPTYSFAAIGTVTP
jgi:hypothetical protein